MKVRPTGGKCPLADGPTVRSPTSAEVAEKDLSWIDVTLEAVDHRYREPVKAEDVQHIVENLRNA